MYKHSIIYYPADEKESARIRKEISMLRCSAAIKYIEALGLNDRQTEALFSRLAEDIAAAVSHKSI